MSSSTQVLYGPAKVGGDVLSYCTRCKMELAHVVVSMIDGRAAKVICKTCKGTHNYKRTGATASFTATRAARKPTERTVIKVSELWEKKMGEAKSTQVRPYGIRDTFSVGEIIQHPQFGMGIVEEVKRHGKITVLFRDSEKVLVHGMAPSQ